MEALLVIFGVIALIFGVLIYGSFSWGFVIYKFWAWFLMPVFPILTVITFWQAVGLYFFISLFHGYSNKTNNDDKTTNTVMVLLGPWLVLAFGWLIKVLFIG